MPHQGKARQIDNTARSSGVSLSMQTILPWYLLESTLIVRSSRLSLSWYKPVTWVTYVQYYRISIGYSYDDNAITTDDKHAVQREARLDCDSVYDSAGLEANLAGLFCHDPTSTRLLLLCTAARKLRLTPKCFTFTTIIPKYTRKRVCDTFATSNCPNIPKCVWG